MNSIEWLIDQLEQKGEMRETPSIRNLQLNIYTSDYLELKRQAKEMHKAEILAAYNKSFELRDKPYSTANKYYQETFGSKGSDNTPMERKLLKSGFFDIVPKQETLHGSLPLDKRHICFDKGHSMFLVTEIDNGSSKYGDHKCSRCGWVDSFQYDYGS